MRERGPRAAAARPAAAGRGLDRRLLVPRLLLRLVRLEHRLPPVRPGRRPRSRARLVPRQAREPGAGAAQPDWIHVDVRRGDLRPGRGSRGPLRLADDDLVQRIRNACELHPWVAKVKEVRKQYGRVKVELEYRRPGVHGRGARRPVSGRYRAGRGCRPESFSPPEAARYPRLAGIGTRARGPGGDPLGRPARRRRGGDCRGAGAGLVAARLAADRPRAAGRDGSAPSHAPTKFTPTAAREILWGHAPGADPGRRAVGRREGRPADTLLPKITARWKGTPARKRSTFARARHPGHAAAGLT